MIEPVMVVTAELIRGEIEMLCHHIQRCRAIALPAKTARLLEVAPDLLDEGEKLIIFTQYRETQRHLAAELNAAGFKTVNFNGDLKSHPEPERDEREKAKRRFREEAQIMITTDAGATGHNFQHCHIAVNYDLPWNPQKVAQRIGRLHRIGQRHDVVIANFAALSHLIEYRIVELLTLKTDLFNSVLDDSEAVLGLLEEESLGVDIAGRILDIVQNCRTPEAIDQAFDELQERMAPELEARRQVGRCQLEAVFDERLQEDLSLVGEKVSAAQTARRVRVQRLVTESLRHHGRPLEPIAGQSKAFLVHTPPGFLEIDNTLPKSFHACFDNALDSPHIVLNQQHLWVKAALEWHQHHGRCSAVRLVVDDTMREREWQTLRGQHGCGSQGCGSQGWWLVFKVGFDGFDGEDHLIHLAFSMEMGQPRFHPFLSANIGRLTLSEGQWNSALCLPTQQEIEELVNQQAAPLLEEIQQRNNTLYLEKRRGLDRYYGTHGDGEVTAELRDKIQKKREEVAAVDSTVNTLIGQPGHTDELIAQMRQRDNLGRQLLQMENQLRADEETNQALKQQKLQHLEDQQQLSITTEMIACAQWQLD